LANINRYVGITLCLTTLTACGTTGRFVDQPRLDIKEPQEDARQAVGELFGLATPYTVKLCEADLASRECKQGSKAITATGVGGLLLPLTLHVKGLVVSRESQSDEGLSLDASFDSAVDGISPLCATARGKIVSRDNNTASVQFGDFYCNWVAIGNVLVNADFSIDSINLQDKVFTGFYKITFHGTGNAAGSGYFKAAVAPKRT
jgi:hypothetical protein